MFVPCFVLVFGEASDLTCTTTWSQHSVPQKLSVVSELLLTWFVIGCQCIGEPSLNFPSRAPREGQGNSSKYQKALMQTRATSGAMSNTLYRDTCVFTSSLRTWTWTCLIPAFLTKESHMPDPVFLEHTGCLSSCICIAYKLCAFFDDSFVHIFTLVLMNSVCLPVYSELYEGCGSVTCRWRYT